ncbi:MAG TPA: molybdopterin converting factor subunit 1 [Planctomycetaceae bacterium]|nr:molybdopterin converting factor subunit 1 [Planctomycetaceae bacterium]
MTIEIQLFAGAAEAVGTNRVRLTDQDFSAVTAVGGAPDSLPRVAQVREALSAKYPELAELVSHSRFAVGSEFASDETVIAEAELALIPPVSGG